MVVPLLVLVAPTQAEKLHHCFSGSKEYLLPLIQLALSHDTTEYELVQAENECTHARQIEEVNAGNLSFMWAGTTEELETQLLPIRIPLFRGLLGHRIFIIRQGDQHKFDNIDSLEALKKIKLGQGRHWGDTTILEARGLHVVKANKYHNLFYMLEGGRFDAFPRGVNEPWAEVEQRPELKLTVEKNLAVVYPMPAYFFTSRTNPGLAEKIERGLRQSIADNSFSELFFSDPNIKKVLAVSNLKSRKMYHIDNPNLPKNTPLDQKELWLDIRSL